MGDEVHHIEPGNTLLVQVVHRMRILLTEDRDQYVGTGDFLLAVARGLHMHDRALYDALETQGGLGIHIIGASHLGGVVLDEVCERRPQVVDVGRTRSQNFRGARVVQQSE